MNAVEYQRLVFDRLLTEAPIDDLVVDGFTLALPGGRMLNRDTAPLAFRDIRRSFSNFGQEFKVVDVVDRLEQNGFALLQLEVPLIHDGDFHVFGTDRIIHPTYAHVTAYASQSFCIVDGRIQWWAATMDLGSLIRALEKAA